MQPSLVDGKKPARTSDIVLDFESMSMISFMVSNDSKMALIMPIDKKRISESRKSRGWKSNELVKTNETKDILGYACQLYRLQNDQEKGEIWLAPDLDIDLTDSFSALGMNFAVADETDSKPMPKGFILEFITRNEQNNELARMKVTDVNLDAPYTFKTKGYVPTRLPAVMDEE